MKKTEKVALLAFASLFAFSFAACGDLNGNGGSNSGGTGSGSGDSDVVAVLPGTSGGSSNASDSFAGKTFYSDSSLSDSRTKYVFGNDGTFTVSSRSGSYDSEAGKYTYGDFEEQPTFEYRYSFSSDGKTFYAAVNKGKIPLSETDSRLMTYSELMDFVKSDEGKALFKGQWNQMTDEEKKSNLSYLGLDENAGFDEYYQAAGLKMVEEMYKPYYSQISLYDIFTETDKSTSASYILLSGKVDSNSRDLSKMNFTGSFGSSTSGSDSRIGSFSIQSYLNGYVAIYPSSSGSSSSTYYAITKIDAAKITFEKQTSSSSSSSEEKETFDATYTVEGSGTNTKIKVTFPEDKGGETVSLTFTPETMSLYEIN